MTPTDTANGTWTRSALYVRVLGPVGITTLDGHSFEVGHRKLQLLLAAIALEPGRAVDVETLARTLWQFEQPDRARGTLQTYISRLRGTLTEAGDEIGLIETAASGYRLAIEPDHVDFHRFEQHVRQAREMAAGGNLPAARNLLTDAEHVWSGRALDGLESPWAVATRAELHRNRDRAKLARIAMDVATGTGVHTVLSELSDLAALNDGVDQDAAELLLYLLGAAKRRREARATYRQVSRSLRESRRELSPGLADLGHRLKRDEPIDATAAVRRAWRRGLAPNRLARPAGLIGREETSFELFGAVSEAVAGPSGLAVHVIHGEAGIGKSALAAKAAHSLVSAHCDGALQIDLRGSDPAGPPLESRDMIAQLLDQIAARTSRPSPSAPAALWATAWSQATRDLRLLVLLDDARDADQVTPLIHGGAGLIVLVTSRQRIELPGARHTALAPLTDVASARLIGAVAGRHFPDQHRAMHRLIMLCAGSPLALILIGAHLRTRPDVPAVVKALTAIAGALPAGAGAIEAAYELSARALAPVGVELLEAVAAGSSPQVGVDDVAAYTDSEPAWVGEILDALAQMRLLQEIGARCYRIPAALREAVLTRAGERL